MNNLPRFTLLSSLAFVTACSNSSGSDNTKATRQSDSLSLPYTQDFESGAGDWSSVNGGVILTSDATSPSGSSVQQLDRRNLGGGDYFSPYLPAHGLQTYCISVKVKWVSGAAPFIGLERLSADTSLGVSWVFGAPYTDGNGSTQVISNTESGWQVVSRTVVFPAGTTRIRLTDELYAAGTKEGPDLSYVDGLSLTNGTCAPYVPYTQDWEGGAGEWVDKSGQGPMLVNDATSPAGATVQQLNRAGVGGDFFSPLQPVAAWKTYCVRTKVKWVGGAAPFVGLEQFSGSDSKGISWLFGTSYKDERGTTLALSRTAPGWQDLSRSIIIPTDVSQVRLVDELYSGSAKAGSSLAFVDGLSLTEGACAPYVQDWESGTGGWLDAAANEPTLVIEDTSSAGATVQRLDRATFGGDFFSPLKEVVGGNTYCVSANVKWVSGAAPFLGIELFSEGASLGVSWLFGTPYTDAHGSTQAISDTESGWQSLSRSVLIPTGATQIRLTNELYVNSAKGGAPLSYFDRVSIADGGCPSDGALGMLAAGLAHTCWLTPYGGVRCWGLNTSGELGDGTWKSRVTPPTNDILVDVKAIAAGDSHTCALMGSGNVRCWGYNVRGALGDGTTSNRSSPTEVVGLAGVRMIAAGGYFMCAVLESGALRCWGSAYGGALGDGTWISRSTQPANDVLTGVKSVAAGAHNACALMESGGVRCWGDGPYGQLGDGTTSNTSRPLSNEVLTGAKAIVAGNDDVCALMDTRGLRCWGRNYFGQLGDGTTGNNRTTPPTTDVLAPVQAVAIGKNHMCALMESGGIRCWGYNGMGQLGDGSWLPQATIPTTDLLPNVKAIAAGYSHTCALMESGGIRCWGYNSDGQLGDGTFMARSTPVEVIPP